MIRGHLGTRDWVTYVSKHNLFLFPDYEGHGGLTLLGPPRTLSAQTELGKETPAVIKSESPCFTKIGEASVWGPRDGSTAPGGRPPAGRALLGGDPGGHDSPGASGKTWGYSKQF